MKLLGIDYGTKRIGLAVSDEGATLAFPKTIVVNDANAFSEIGKVLKEENISEIVIGESEDFHGRENELMAFIRDFVARAGKEFGLPVHLEKEFLTSVEARKSRPDMERVDAAAAALILQRYLDRYNKEKSR